MSVDEIGPESVVRVYDPETGMQGVIVLDSFARGPAKGGIRFAESATEEEVRGLARAMTIKNALADLPFGGGKSGITADPSALSASEQEAYVRAFGRFLSMLAPKHYVAAPDMGIGEAEIRLLVEVAGREAVTGKPVDLGGVEQKAGSTGFGVFVSVREFFAQRNESLEGKTVAVQGFGQVGGYAAQFLAERGALVVGVSDFSGAVIDEGGLDVDELLLFTRGGGRLKDFSGSGRKASSDAPLFLDVDVLVPAAQRHVITEENYLDVSARVISQGANSPIASSVERLLEERGVFVIPDVLANAGGVIGSWVEHVGGSSEQVFSRVEEVISSNMALLASCMRERGVGSREAVLLLARGRLGR